MRENFFRGINKIIKQVKPNALRHARKAMFAIIMFDYYSDGRCFGNSIIPPKRYAKHWMFDLANLYPRSLLSGPRKEKKWTKTKNALGKKDQFKLVLVSIEN